MGRSLKVRTLYFYIIIAILFHYWVEQNQLSFLLPNSLFVVKLFFYSYSYWIVPLKFVEFLTDICA